jgi:hypothetical protein
LSRECCVRAVAFAPHVGNFSIRGVGGEGFGRRLWRKPIDLT